MAKTKTGYLTMEWTDPEGVVRPEGDAFEFPFETYEDQVDYESLVSIGVITHTARQAGKVVASREETPEPEPGPDAITSTSPGV